MIRCICRHIKLASATAAGLHVRDGPHREGKGVGAINGGHVQNFARISGQSEVSSKERKKGLCHQETKSAQSESLLSAL